MALVFFLQNGNSLRAIHASTRARMHARTHTRTTCTGDDGNNDSRFTIHDPRDLAGATRDERGSAISNEIIGERIDHKGGRIIDSHAYRVRNVACRPITGGGRACYNDPSAESS